MLTDSLAREASERSRKLCARALGLNLTRHHFLSLRGKQGVKLAFRNWLWLPFALVCATPLLKALFPDASTEEGDASGPAGADV